MANKKTPTKTEELCLGLALSGGGARGAYQYGVWRALEDRGLSEHIQVIAGTSIGAINAMLFLQEKISRDAVARTFWEELDLSNLFSIMPPGRKELEVRDYLRLGWDGLLHFGIRIDPLKEWVRHNLRPQVLLNQPFVIWANSWNMLRLREEAWRLPGTDPEVFLEGMLGSASFPFFGPHYYRGQYLLDGGISNNLPLHLVFRESVDRVLAVDLATFMRFHPRQLMLERKYHEKTHFVRVGLDLPSPAHFSRSSIDLLIERGWSDAKRWEI